MGGLSLWHWIIVLLVVLILFGRGRISEIMGDFGKGIKSFKEGINDESGERRTPAAPPTPQIASPTPEAAPAPQPATTQQPTSAPSETKTGG